MSDRDVIQNEFGIKLHGSPYNEPRAVKHCGACGEDHDIVFYPLNEACHMQGDAYTHVGYCKAGNKPVYMRRVKNEQP